VGFITLNYDDLAERALGVYSPRFTFGSMEEYMLRDTPFMKAHGSIDWAVQIGEVTDDGHRDDAWDALVAETDLKSLDTEKLRVIRGVRSAKHWFAGHQPGTDRLRAVYPLLTAPLAGKSPTDIVAPSSIQKVMADFLSDCRRFLIVGSSGLDDDLLEFLSSAVVKADLVQVVSGRPAEGDELAWSNATLMRYQAGVRAFGEAARAVPLPLGFVDYVNSEHASEL